MNAQLNNSQKPTLINVIAWMTLASGVVNLIWGVVASSHLLATVIGVVCVPFTILPTVLGVFELIYSAKLLSNPAQPVLPSTYIAVFEIACVLVGNVFAMIVGILALVFYNDTVVKDYFASLNGLAPVTSIVLPVVPEPPVSEMEEPAMPETPEPPPAPPLSKESPSKPKRKGKSTEE